MFCAGLAVGFLPQCYWLLSDFSSYYFNNLGYHLNRRQGSFAEELQKKEIIFRILTGLRETQKFEGFQFPMLLLSNILLLLSSVFVRSKLIVASAFALCLAVLSFLPSPTYVQYFSLSVPFLCVGAAGLCSLLLSRRLLLYLAMILFLVFYLLPFPEDYKNYTRSGKGVIGIGNASNAKTWRVEPVEEVAQWLSEHARPHEQVMSSWPGFLLSAPVRSYPELENHFGLYIADRVPVADRRKFKIMSWSEFSEKIARGSTRLLVLEQRFIQRKMQEALVRGGYEIAFEVEKFTIFQKGQRPSGC